MITLLKVLQKIDIWYNIEKASIRTVRLAFMFFCTLIIEVAAQTVDESAKLSSGS